jgi:hypothetical protein
MYRYIHPRLSSVKSARTCIHILIHAWHPSHPYVQPISILLLFLHPASHYILYEPPPPSSDVRNNSLSVFFAILHTCPLIQSHRFRRCIHLSLRSENQNLHAHVSSIPYSLVANVETALAAFLVSSWRCCFTWDFSFSYSLL